MEIGCNAQMPVAYPANGLKEQWREVAHVDRGERRTDDLALFLVLCAIGRQKPSSDRQVT